MQRRKPCVVSTGVLDPTWAPTNNPPAAPAIASPMRSRTCAALLTRNRIDDTHLTPSNQVTAVLPHVEGTDDDVAVPARRRPCEVTSRRLPGSPPAAAQQAGHRRQGYRPER